MSNGLRIHLAVFLLLFVQIAGCTSEETSGEQLPSLPPESPERIHELSEEPPTETEEPRERAVEPRPALVGSRWGVPLHLPQAKEPTVTSTEPGILTTPRNEVLVFGTLTDAWRSIDGGKSFEYMGWPECRHSVLCETGVTGYASSRVGGGDGDLAVLADGMLAWVGLRGGGLSVPFQRSSDGGASWSEAIDLAEGNTTDRQWIVRAPGDVLHVVWRDMGNSTTSGLWRDTEDRVAIMRRASLDGGDTWGPITPVIDGQRPAIGKPAVDPTTGSIYLSVNSANFDVYASHDGGITWSASRVPSREMDTTFGTLVRFAWPDVAVDGAGNVYATWAAEEVPAADLLRPLADQPETARPSVYVSVSMDRGATWSPPHQLSRPGHSAIMPTIVAGAAGRVGVAWYETALPLPGEATPNRWNLHFAQTVTADAEQPVWNLVEVVPSVHTGAICTQGLQCEATDRSRGEFFDMAIRPNGLAIISYVQDEETVTPTGHTTSIAVVRMESGTRFY